MSKLTNVEPKAEQKVSDRVSPETDIQASNEDVRRVAVRKARAAIDTVINECFEDAEPDTFSYRTSYQRLQSLLEMASDYLFVADRCVSGKA